MSIAQQLPGISLKALSKTYPCSSPSKFLNLLMPKLCSPGSVLLLSGGNGDCVQHSIAGWDPLAIFSCKGKRCRLQFKDRLIHEEEDPVYALQDMLTGIERENRNIHFKLPFQGGAMGYLAYDTKNVLERLPQHTVDDLQLPDMYWTFPSKVSILDHRKKDVRFLQWDYADKKFSGTTTGVPFWETNNFFDGLSGKGPEKSFRIGTISSNFTREQYLEAIRKIRHYIEEGHVYQVNLSQRFHAEFHGDPLSLFSTLFEHNPAPFYGYIHAGDHHIVCTSMERFLWSDGHTLETRPIKGTRPKGATPQEDDQYRNDLLKSPKDEAELSMIVDLLRNDIGKVCVSGSVKVREHKRLESYRYVHHLVSIIDGRLSPKKGIADILRATFPGGSITGCPKIRAMELIEELEPHCRHIYTGSIGYLGIYGQMDLNIAIRTLIIKASRCYYGAGGGIVYDSVPEKEYEETMHKAKAFLMLKFYRSKTRNFFGQEEMKNVF
jgi:para-aminobenzoate synthetase component 1